MKASMKKVRSRWAPLLALGVTTSLVLVATWAGADVADLKQGIDDLSSQTSDKERMDTAGAAKVEVSQIRTWLGEATNAVKEENADRCRRLMTRVRAQLVLIDHLVTLAKSRASLDKQKAALSAAKQQVAAADKTLSDKRAKVKALKMTQPSASK